MSIPIINQIEMKTSPMLSANAHMRGPAAARHPPRNIVNLGPTCSHNRLAIGPKIKMKSF